jgi:hypothetical protein
MLPLTWTNAGPRRLVLVPQGAGQAPEWEDAIVYPAGSQGGWWAAPYHRGQYDLLAFGWDDQGMHSLGTLAHLSLDLSEQMASTQVESVRFDRALRQGRWASVTIGLNGPELDGLDCLAYLSFTRGAKGQDPLLPVQAGAGDGKVSNIPHSQMQEVRVEKGQLKLWTPLPDQDGSYRVDLFLSTNFGSLLRLRGVEVVVEP